MPLSITPESKSNILITNESKDETMTWDEMDISWDEVTGTWDRHGSLQIKKDTKNTLNITNETKL